MANLFRAVLMGLDTKKDYFTAMGTPKKRTRRIKVNGQEYRWVASWSSAARATLLIVYAVLGEEQGQALHLLDDPQYAPDGPKGVTPGYVRHEILSAISSGWDPQIVGGEYHRDMRRRQYMPDFGRPLRWGAIDPRRLRLRVHAEPGLLDYQYPWEHITDRWMTFRFFYGMKPIQAGTIIARIADYNGISPEDSRETIMLKLAGKLPLDSDPDIAAKMRTNYEIAGGIAIIIGARKLMMYGRGVDSSHWMFWWAMAHGEVYGTWNGHDPNSGAIREGDTIVLQGVHMREREFPIPASRYLEMVDALEEDIEGGLDVLQEWLENEAPEDCVEIIMDGIRDAIYSPLKEAAEAAEAAAAAAEAEAEEGEESAEDASDEVAAETAEEAAESEDAPVEEAPAEKDTATDSEEAAEEAPDKEEE